MILNEYDSIYSGEQVDLGITLALKLPNNVDEVLGDVGQHTKDIESLRDSISEYMSQIAELRQQLNSLNTLIEGKDTSKGVTLSIYKQETKPEAPAKDSLKLFAGLNDQGAPELMVCNSEGVISPVGHCELQATKQDDRLHLEVKELILK